MWFLGRALVHNIGATGSLLFAHSVSEPNPADATGKIYHPKQKNPGHEGRGGNARCRGKTRALGDCVFPLAVFERGQFVIGPLRPMSTRADLDIVSIGGVSGPLSQKPPGVYL